MVIEWDEFFMFSAKLASMRSKDPSTQVGAVIVDNNNKIIASGYNGMPGGKDDCFTWQKTDPEDNKYQYVVHAELNCILNSNKSCTDCILYVTKFPCNECAKAIVQSKIKKVVYSDPIYSENPNNPSEKIFRHCGIILEKYNKRMNLTIDLL
jgi:dCMP deaminase